MKVGELAAASGLSVRAMRYYDQTGLLRPSRRSAGGHRLYDDADVRRLYRVCLLRRAGFSLGEIGRSLDDPTWDLRGALSAHLEMLDQEVAAGSATRRRVAAMLAALAAERLPPTTEFLEALEEMAVSAPALHRRIAILVYDDLPAAAAWLVRVFGLSPGRLDHDVSGECVHGEVHAGTGVVWLHPARPQFGLASPRTAGVSTAMTAVMVEDVDDHHRRAESEGAQIVYPPTDMAYGYREYSARDLEGGLWSFMTPLPPAGVGS